jgi:hypothetical protein
MLATVRDILIILVLLGTLYDRFKSEEKPEEKTEESLKIPPISLEEDAELRQQPVLLLE